MLPLLLLHGFRTLVDALHGELAAQGHADARPVHGFVLQAVGVDGTTAVELGRSLGVTKQDAAKHVEALERLGYLTRRPDPADARRKLVRLTGRGIDLLDRSAAVFDDLRAEWERTLGADRLRALEADLRRMTPGAALRVASPDGSPEVVGGMIGPVTNPLLQIVIGSTRPGRIGLPVGRWIEKAAVDHGAFDVEVVDLAEIDLPMFDEPVHPRMKQYAHDHTKAWSATIDRADAFVFVMPEYNHSFNGALKNAIDYLFHEWNHKPVGTVSYGGVAGGIRAVQQLKPVLAALSAPVMVAAVPIPFVTNHVSGEGDAQTFTPNDPLTAGATAMFDALAGWLPASRVLRTG